MKHLLCSIIILISSEVIFSQDSLNCYVVSHSDSLFSSYPYAFAVDDTLAFGGSNEFTIINIADIYNPIVVSRSTFGSTIWAISIYNNQAYLACKDGLRIIDIDSLESPKLITYYQTEEYIEEVKVKDNIVYLGTLNYSFLIIDVTDPLDPFEITRVDEDIDDVCGIEIYDSLLFAASEDTGVKIFDIADPSKPIELASLHLKPNSTVVDMVLKDNIIYAAHPRDLNVFDISDMSNPKDVAFLEWAGGSAIEIEGDFLYCSNPTGLKVVDVSTPSTPEIVGYYPNVRGDLFVENKLVIIPGKGNGLYFVQFDEPTYVKDREIFAEQFKLYQNFPNPFNPSTTIRYCISRSSNIEIELYNTVGQLIKTLFSGYKTGGEHKIEIDVGDLASGVYIYRVISGQHSQSKKMVLMK